MCECVTLISAERSICVLCRQLSITINTKCYCLHSSSERGTTTYKFAAFKLDKQLTLFAIANTIAIKIKWNDDNNDATCLSTMLRKTQIEKKKIESVRSSNSQAQHLKWSKSIQFLLWFQYNLCDLTSDVMRAHTETYCSFLFKINIHLYAPQSAFILFKCADFGLFAFSISFCFTFSLFGMNFATFFYCYYFRIHTSGTAYSQCTRRVYLFVCFSFTFAMMLCAHIKRSKSAIIICNSRSQVQQFFFGWFIWVCFFSSISDRCRFLRIQKFSHIHRSGEREIGIVLLLFVLWAFLHTVFDHFHILLFDMYISAARHGNNNFLKRRSHACVCARLYAPRQSYLPATCLLAFLPALYLCVASIVFLVFFHTHAQHLSQMQTNTYNKNIIYYLFEYE